MNNFPITDFIEKMRVVGYPNIISVDSFRSPNFPLTADILSFLIKSYDPQADIPTDISGEGERIIFIKSVASFLASKMHVKINTRRVYSADGFAVKELQKIVAVLYGAMNAALTADDEVGIPAFLVDGTLIAAGPTSGIKLDS